MSDSTSLGSRQPSPNMWRCPTTSESQFGLMRMANGTRAAVSGESDAVCAPSGGRGAGGSPSNRFSSLFLSVIKFFERSNKSIS